MHTVYVDADACPVRDEALRIAARHGAAVLLVTNGGLRPVDGPRARVVYVDDGPDAADRWIAEHAGPGDIVVTADIVLAARALEAGAQVLRHDGTGLDAGNIGTTLAMRDLMSDLRAADPLRQGGGGKPFSRADRARFAQALDTALHRAQNHPPRPDDPN